jgi:hypothetical protein
LKCFIITCTKESKTDKVRERESERDKARETTGERKKERATEMTKEGDKDKMSG